MTAVGARNRKRANVKIQKKKNSIHIYYLKKDPINIAKICNLQSENPPLVLKVEIFFYKMKIMCIHIEEYVIFFLHIFKGCQLIFESPCIGTWNQI